MECPVCRLPETNVHTQQSIDRFHVECARCGTFFISRTAVAALRHRDANFALSSWIRTQEGGSSPPFLSSTSIEQVESTLPRYSVPEKQLIFLRAVERQSKFAGARVKIATQLDFTLAWLQSAEELEFIIRALLGRDLIAIEGFADPQHSSSHDLIITPRGWDYLDEHAKPAQFSNQAFVAMAFSQELRPAWSDGLVPALKAAGFHAYRVDAEPHLDRIDVKIVSEIKNSRFLVADVTLQRPGVYFEAGFALGLGLPVVWCVREDELAKVHFDTRQYNHVVWRTPDHLRDQLTPFVTAVIGRGTAA